MFGYIKIYEDELKIKDYKIYKSYYCGLCKTLGKRYGFVSRLGLSYDFTFMALLLDSFKNSENNIIRENCIKHIKTKKNQGYVQLGDAIDYSADMSVLLTYHKLNDDFCDTRGIKRIISFFSMALCRGAYKKAAKKYPEISKDIEKYLKELSLLEKEKCDDADKTAYCFSKILKCILSAYASEFDDFSIALGRFIYLIDAFDDLLKDLNRGEYNPYIYMYKLKDSKDEKIPLACEAINSSIYMTLSMMGGYLKNINFKKNEDIINNIIYLGLRQVADAICNQNIERNGKLNE